MLDDTPLAAADLGALYMADDTMLGEARSNACAAWLRALNPYVRVACETGEPTSDALLAQYTTVCVSGASWSAVERIAEACRRNKVKLYIGDCMGMFGYFFADLGDQFEFSKPKESAGEDGEKITTYTQHRLACLSLSEAVARPASALPRRVPPLYWVLLLLRRFESEQGRAMTAADVEAAAAGDANVDGELLARVVHGLGVDLSAVCTVVGGILGQEIVRTSAADDTPINGFLFYDAQRGDALAVESAKPTLIE